MALALSRLTTAPYEPLKDAEERLLAHKTLFLLALASAKRVGNSTPCLSLRWVGRGVLQFCTRFRGQNSGPVLPRPALLELHDSGPTEIEGLSQWETFVPGTCSQTLSGPRCERLFVASGRTKKEISKNTVSFWLRRVISLAYQLSGRPLPTSSPLTRETRGIAPSLFFKKNYAVSQVLKAGTWRWHTTFTRHYLRDLSHKSLDTFHLGPVVAAQATV